MADTAKRLADALAERYAIERELGSGGMATVYLAEDLKHRRKVAVKVLRPDLAAALGPERFLREIEVAANLTHPHILPLHDSGEADGFLYYVMPYIAGESLRDRIVREGELPVGDALKIVREVVDALASAHRNGVVHRDIKPDNVLLSEGHAMVTDFGVAKAVSEATGREKLTTAGIALGTPAYMAPEQAAADPHIDHRADIYAVGALAYELLAGRPPFSRATPQAVLAAHVNEIPEPMTTHRAAVPPGVSQVLMRCLEKKPADRWQSAADLLVQLEALATPSGGITPTGMTPVAAAPAGRGNRVAVLTGATVAIAVLGFLGWSSLRRGGPSVTVSNIRQITREPEVEYEPVVSPDGGEVAYTAGYGRDTEVYVRSLDGGRAIVLTADRPGRQFLPHWTSDGSNIVFVDPGGDRRASPLQLVPRFGGASRPVLMPGDGYWQGLLGDRMLYQRSDTLFTRPLEGGAAEVVAEGVALDAHSGAWSPDGSMVAYVTGNPFYIDAGNLGNEAPSAIWIVAVPGGDPVEVVGGGALNVSPAWLPDSRQLLFISNREGPRDLYVVRVDGRGRPRGEPVRVTTGLDAHSVSISADGRVAVYSQLSLRRNIWAVDLPASGSVSLSQARPVTRGNQIVEARDVSPDGEWIAFDSNLQGTQDIYIQPTAGGEARRVTTDPGHDFHPSFSPDGRELAFHSTRHGSRDLFLIGANGSGEQRLTDDPGDEMNPWFSPDGLSILFRTQDGLSVMTRDEVGGAWSEPRVLAPSSGNAGWSPDGQHVVFGHPDGLMVVSLDGAQRLLVDLEDGEFRTAGAPAWSEEGIVYFEAMRADETRGIYAVSADGGTPRLVVRYDDPAKDVQYDSALSGRTMYLAVTEYESDIYAMSLEY